MSKAINLTPFVQKLKKLSRKFLAMSQQKMGQIPAIGSIPSFSNLNIPPIPLIATEITYHYSGKGAFLDMEKSKHRDKDVWLKKRLTAQNAFKENELHEKIMLILKKTGYSVNEVKALPSGEKLIFISDILGDLDQEPRAYEYVHRRGGNNEQNL